MVTRDLNQSRALKPGIKARLLLGGACEFVFLILIGACILSGCFSKPVDNIPSVAKDHPANKFYQFVSQNPVTDRVCRDHKGDPSIPMGEISKGEKFAKSADLAPGVFRFKDKSTGKNYLGVTYLQYQGFLQIPKLCAWEDNQG